MKERPTQIERTREKLWEDRERYLPHLLEHTGCGINDGVANLCERVGWTYESYLLAALFDREELIVEVTK